MNTSHPNSAPNYRLVHDFESVRKTLMDGRFRDKLDRPLGFWALPNDRRLPIALLGHRVGDLLSMKFDEVMSTPGIGEKKVASLVTLLHRAVDDEASPRVNGHNGHNGNHAKNGNGASPGKNGKFDASRVSESLWAEWQERVRDAGLGSELLGKLVRSLQDIPTVIWETPLSFYLDKTLAEIRSLKSYGEKRVAGILRVFYDVNHMLYCAREDSPIVLRPVPRFVVKVENWLDRASNPLSFEEINANLVSTLLEQIKADVGENVAGLVKGRLDIDGEIQTVCGQSREAGVTRARIYQLFDESASVMKVRWPEGRQKLAKLLQSLQSSNGDPRAITLVDTLGNLLYPKRELHLA